MQLKDFDHSTKVVEKYPLETLFPIDDAEYHSMNLISSHGLMQCLRSPAHYLASKRYRKESSAFAFGTAAHLATLQPAEFDKRIRIEPEVKRTSNAGKAEHAEFEASLKPGDLPISSKELEQLSRMAEKFRESPEVAELLAGENQNAIEHCLLSAQFHKEIIFKCKPDLYNPDLNAVIDYKTTDDASPEAFAASAAKYLYHLQAAAYLSATRAQAFYIIAQEKSYPYSVAVYEMTGHEIKAGEVLFAKAFANYALAYHNGVFEYAPGVQKLNMPAWALREVL